MTIYERFQGKYIPVTESGCWLWLASCHNDGYGWFSLNGRMYLAHRIAYELYKEPIPNGLEIDHLCRVRSCVNPDHLEAITHKENISCGLNNGKRIACPKGHEYTKLNTRIYKGSRFCRQCDRDRRKVVVA